jgi:hypothetical protein
MLTSSPGWELDVDRGPDWLLVKVRRPRESAAEPQPLSDVAWDLLERHLTHRLVLDMDCVDHFDEELISQLVNLYSRVADHGGVMRVCGLSAENRRMLSDRHLDDRLVPYCDMGDAVLGHTVPRQPR